MTTVPQTYFGPTKHQRRGDVLAAPVGAVIGISVTASLDPGVRWYSALVSIAVVLLVGVGIRAAVDQHQGLTVSPYGVRIRRRTREVDVPWAEVQDVVVRHGWAGTRSVRIVTARRTLRAGYPCTYPGGRDPEFDAKVDGIRSWWTTRPTSP